MDMSEGAKYFTRELRESDDPSWVRLREFLQMQGIDLADAAIGDRFTESDGDFGVLVTHDDRVFTFTFLPGGRGDITRMIRETTIQDWRERTSERDRFTYGNEIAAAKQVLVEEGRKKPRLEPPP
jgi:hypothetical protein